MSDSDLAETKREVDGLLKDLEVWDQHRGRTEDAFPDAEHVKMLKSREPKRLQQWEKIIAALNFGCKQLLSDQSFLTKMARAISLTQRHIDWLRDSTPGGCDCCCSLRGHKPYGGVRFLQNTCEAQRALLSKSSASFSLSLNLTGSSHVSGGSDDKFVVDGTHDVLVAEPNMPTSPMEPGVDASTDTKRSGVVYPADVTPTFAGNA
jgi:hypothetical protein